MIVIDKNPTGRKLRQFGVIWLLFFTAAAGFGWYRGGDLRLLAPVWAVAVAVALAGFLHLPFMRLVFVGMSYVTFPIGMTVSHLLLAIIYYLIVTPIALILRMVGRDPLERRLDTSADSYWSPHPDGEDESRYFRQF